MSDPSVIELPSGKPQKIGILGAGMAGLAAAEALVKAGHKVVILEAQNRAGGRVHTLRESFAEGLYVEAGANRFPDSHPLTMAYCRRLGLPLVDFAPPGLENVFWFQNHRFLEGSRLPEWLDLKDSEKGLTMARLQDFYLQPLLDKMGDPLDPGWPRGDLLEWDDLSFAELLRAQGASRSALGLMSCGFNVGEGLEGASALWLLRSYGLDRDRHNLQRIDGGNDKLPLALARHLSAQLHYGSVVVSLQQDDMGVEVVVRQNFGLHTWRFDRVICTLPFPTLQSVDFLPLLSAGKRRAIRELPYASMVKVFLQTSQRFWDEDGLSGFAVADLGMTEIWNVTEGGQGQRGVLLAYLGGASARQLATLSPSAQIHTIVERLLPVFPRLKDYFEVGLTLSWDADPWAKGAGAWFATGQIQSLYPHIATPEGRIHFAGEHTSPWPGWVQGALHSGQRAALEVAGAC